MSLTDFTDLINVYVVVFVVSIPNESEGRVISEFEMDFKKSCLTSSVHSTHTRAENRYGFRRRV